MLDIYQLKEGILTGNKRSIARGITTIENYPDKGKKLIRELFPHTGRAHIIGVTGPPGSGKSTLVNQLAVHFSDRGSKVGIIAVDPTSPFSGGALLGDRIRMTRAALNKSIFIRSMGSRGNLGGLSKATMDAIRLLDAAGFDKIIVETVGAGQSEIDIVRCAHTTLVLGIPGTGDAVQAIKAGILEIADIYVVNKGDRPGANNLVEELKVLISLDPRLDESKWTIPIIQTIALKDEGVDRLVTAIEEHYDFLQTDSVEALEKEKERRKFEILEIIRAEIFDNMLNSLISKTTWDELLMKIIDKSIDPYSAAESIMNPLFNSNDK